MAEELRLALLSGLQVERGNVPVTGFVSTKMQALLCSPAITGRPHLRGVLVGLLWGEMPAASANTNFRRALSNLRRLVGDDLTIIPHRVAPLASELRAQLPPQILSVVNEQGKVRTLEEVPEPFLARRPATSLRKGE